MSETIQAPDIVTFGCRLNTYESEVMRGHAMAAGLSELVIINTCAVTGEAVRQARQAIRKLRRERPGATIMVTGCAAQIDPDLFAGMKEVSCVVGNDLKMQAETYTRLGQERVLISDMQKVRDVASHMVQGFEGRARAFVQVQNGCDHRCTFCVVPFGRGPSRSVPVAQVVAEVRALAAQGYHEMALTGVDITAYRGEEGQRLGDLVRAVLAGVPELKRLRLSSLDPADMDEALWDVFGHDPRLLPHLHLSMQSGDPMILKRMKRRHTPDDIKAFTDRARLLRPDVALGADIIAGFPTETDAMFENTLTLTKACGLTWLHVFPYSARYGTPAARMPQIPMPVRRARAAQLRAYGEEAVGRHIDELLGKEFEVLVEKPDLGRAPDFTEVRLADPAEVGHVIRVRCTGREGKFARATFLKQGV